MATDRVPDVIHAYFKAVDDRDFDNLKNLLADDAVIATASGRPGAPRLVRTGAQLRREMVSRDPVPWCHRVVDVHVHGAGALVQGELVRPEAGTPDGFVAFFAVDEEGRVAGLASFGPRDPDVDRAAAGCAEWADVGAFVINDQPAADVPSVDEVVAVIGGAGATAGDGLTVAWRTRDALPVAVVGRLGRVGDFAAVVRSEGPGVAPQVDAAWAPLVREERS